MIRSGEQQNIEVRSRTLRGSVPRGLWRILSHPGRRFKAAVWDETVLFLIPLISPKLLLPEMTWQVLQRDVIECSLKGTAVEWHRDVSVRKPCCQRCADASPLFTPVRDFNHNQIINVPSALSISLETGIKYK